MGIISILVIIGIGYFYFENHKKRSTLVWDYELRQKVSYILVADFRANDDEIVGFFTHRSYKKYLKKYKGEEYLSKEQLDDLGISYIEYLKDRNA